MIERKHQHQHKRRPKRPPMRFNPDQTTLFFDAAMLILDDACPPSKACHLCRHEDGDLEGDESTCTRCWRHYLMRIANGRVGAPYVVDEINQGI